jgi:hypothetical protein
MWLGFPPPPKTLPAAIPTIFLSQFTSEGPNRAGQGGTNGQGVTGLASHASARLHYCRLLYEGQSHDMLQQAPTRTTFFLSTDIQYSTKHLTTASVTVFNCSSSLL